MKKINIAIDGNSSCGKSTTSKLLAGRLRYKYIDTGAMYRAVTLYFLREGVDPDDESRVKKALQHISVDFLPDGNGCRTLLNGKDVEEEIRSMKVAAMVSRISALTPVRRKLVEEQRVIASGKGVVMDGRDIGTVVLPDAELKIFMTASIEARSRRRFDELQGKGQAVTLEEVEANLTERDRMDSQRQDSPLRQAEDAHLLDTSDMTIEQQTDWICKKVMQLLHQD